MAEISVREVVAVDGDEYDGVLRLLPQLSASADRLTPQDFAELVAAPATRLLIASSPAGEVVGMLTVVLVRIPTGVSAHVEDVVVDQDARGQGVGRLLMSRAIEVAREANARHLDLTSRPTRLAANSLYQSLGFATRETNAYRLSLFTDQAGPDSA